MYVRKTACCFPTNRLFSVKRIMNYLQRLVDFRRRRRYLACSYLKFINEVLSNSWIESAFDVLKNTRINISDGFSLKSITISSEVKVNCLERTTCKPLLKGYLQETFQIIKRKLLCTEKLFVPPTALKNEFNLLSLPNCYGFILMAEYVSK